MNEERKRMSQEVETRMNAAKTNPNSGSEKRGAPTTNSKANSARGERRVVRWIKGREEGYGTGGWHDGLRREEGTIGE